MTKSSKPNYGAWVLKFIGSLVYLYVLDKLWQPGTALGVFGPVLFGIAAVAAVALFITNLVSLVTPKSKDSIMWMARVGYVGGFALLASAYTVSPASTAMGLLVEALMGFVLVYIGSGIEMGG